MMTTTIEPPQPSIPDRFSILEEDYREKALESLRTKGAVILTDVVPPNGGGGDATTSWKSTAEGIPRLLFSPEDLRLSRHEASPVHAEHHGTPGEMNGKGLLPHTDGYVWGDRNPDVVVLLCEQSSPEGGDNYLIDGERMLRRMLLQQPQPPRLLEILTNARVDHTERLEHGFGAVGIESFVPVFRREARRTQAAAGGSWLDAPAPDATEQSPGRLRWRRMIPLQISKGLRPIDENTYMSCWKALEDEDESGGFSQSEVTEAITVLDREIFRETEGVPRFTLRPGECLVADNYRMLHAREAYTPNSEEHTHDGGNRKMWRVWSWTVESEGLPPGMNDDHQATTVLGAGKFIHEQSQQQSGIEVN